MHSATQRLVLAAVALRGQAPDAWAEFVAALDQAAVRAAEDCVASPPEHIHVSQGRAQQVRALVTTLSQCRELAAKIQPPRSK